MNSFLVLILESLIINSDPNHTFIVIILIIYNFS